MSALHCVIFALQLSSCLRQLHEQLVQLGKYEVLTQDAQCMRRRATNSHCQLTMVSRSFSLRIEILC